MSHLEAQRADLLQAREHIDQALALLDQLEEEADAELQVEADRLAKTEPQLLQEGDDAGPREAEDDADEAAERDEVAQLRELLTRAADYLEDHPDDYQAERLLDDINGVL